MVNCFEMRTCFDRIAKDHLFHGACAFGRGILALVAFLASGVAVLLDQNGMSTSPEDASVTALRQPPWPSV